MATLVLVAGQHDSKKKTLDNERLAQILILPPRGVHIQLKRLQSRMIMEVTIWILSKSESTLQEKEKTLV